MVDMQQEILDAAPPSGARFEDGTELARFIGVLAATYSVVESDINQLYDSRYVDSASGLELDRLGLEFGVTRPPGEGDTRFRKRVGIGRKISFSRTTWDDLAEVALDLLETEEGKLRITKDFDAELGAVIVRAYTSDIDDSPFTEAEIIDFLERAIPGSRRIKLEYLNGFQFSDPATTGSKLGEGFGQGVWQS
jgi:hypothetical protein